MLNEILLFKYKKNFFILETLEFEKSFSCIIMHEKYKYLDMKLVYMLSLFRHYNLRASTLSMHLNKINRRT